MKILFPAFSFYPVQLGPNNQFYWLSKELQRGGHEITIITTDLGLTSTHQVSKNKWIKTPFGSIIYFSGLLHKIPLKLLVVSLLHVPKNEIVHLSSLFYPPSLVIAIYALLFRKKVVWSPSGELSDFALSHKKFRKKIWIIIIKIFKKHFLFHATSEFEKQDILKKIGSVKNIMIPILFELPVPITTPKKKQLLYLGRMNPIKAIENLIEGLSLSALFKNSEYTMLITGSKDNLPYYQKIQTLILQYQLTDKVFFKDSVEDPAKSILIAESWFSFLVSHSENFGVVVIESLAQGTPVSASTGTPWKILEEYNAGYWVSNDPATLSKHIDNIISLDPISYDKMSKNAQNVTLEIFDIQKGIHKWNKVYSD
jgi:glycosyltransferase involved in cell wall biosynthesis